MSLTMFHGENFDYQDVRTGLSGEAIGFERACVKLSSGELVKTTADTDAAVGLAYEDYADADANTEYIQKGRLRYVAGGTIAEGEQLCPDHGTAGRIRKAASGDRVVGTAVTSGTAGEFAIGDFDFIANTLV